MTYNLSLIHIWGLWRHIWADPFRTCEWVSESFLFRHKTFHWGGFMTVWKPDVRFMVHKVSNYCISMYFAFICMGSTISLVLPATTQFRHNRIIPRSTVDVQKRTLKMVTQTNTGSRYVCFIGQQRQTSLTKEWRA